MGYFFCRRSKSCTEITYRIWNPQNTEKYLWKINCRVLKTHTALFFLPAKELFTKACILLLFFLFSMSAVSAQSGALPENKLKAVFLYNFTRFIDWPAEAFYSSNAPFVIGIIGNDPFGNYIEEAVAGENISGHPIIVKRFQNVKDVACHILYINSNDPETTREILSTLSNRSILTVSDQKNFVKWGGMVRFFSEENKIRLQINNSAAKAAQLNISSKLLAVAQVY